MSQDDFDLLRHLRVVLPWHRGAAAPQRPSPSESFAPQRGSREARPARLESVASQREPQRRRCVRLKRASVWATLSWPVRGLAVVCWR